MKKKTQQLLEGVDASRRVGWAKYYALRAENDHLKWLVRLLVRRILFHNRLSHDDPLVVLAQELDLAV